MIPVLNLHRPLKNAMVKAVFEAWLELGNQNPLDWRGATRGTRACLKFARDGFGNGETLNLEGVTGCSRCTEVLVYLEAIASLSDVGNSEQVLEKMCQLSYVGNRRAQRVLAGLGFLLFEDNFNVPGLDEERKRVEAGEFFMECGELRHAARILSSGEWWGRDSYLCGGRILLEQGLEQEAMEAFRIGDGLGETGCRGYLVAMESRRGKMDARKFRIIQAAAERGFHLPLAVASRALADGDGIDPDPLLSSFYKSLTAFSDRVLDESLGGTTEEKDSQGFFEMIFSWAGKHPQDPIFLEASKRWCRNLGKRKKHYQN